MMHVVVAVKEEKEFGVIVAVVNSMHSIVSRPISAGADENFQPGNLHHALLKRLPIRAQNISDDLRRLALKWSWIKLLVLANEVAVEIDRREIELHKRRAVDVGRVLAQHQDRFIRHDCLSRDGLQNNPEHVQIRIVARNDE